MAHSDNKNNLNPSDGKEILCDNPISLDEIEDGLWLGRLFCCLCLHIPFSSFIALLVYVRLSIIHDRSHSTHES